MKHNKPIKYARKIEYEMQSKERNGIFNTKRCRKERAITMQGRKEVYFQATETK
jgi:hypothetical protein